MENWKTNWAYNLYLKQRKRSVFIFSFKMASRSALVAWKAWISDSILFF